MASLNPLRRLPGIQVRELSGQRLSANLAGAPIPEAHSNNYSFLFDGIDGMAQSASGVGIVGTNGTTYSLWVNSVTRGNSDVLFTIMNAGSTSAGRVGIGYNSYTYTVSVNNDAGATATDPWNWDYMLSIPLADWHHVVVVDHSTPSAAGEVHVYINGIKPPLTFTGVIASGSVHGSRRYTVAKSEYYATYHNGRIDEITIWDCAMTDEEVWGLAPKNAPVIPQLHSKSDKLSSWYRMGDGKVGDTPNSGAGTGIIYDQGPAGINLTCTGMVEADKVTVAPALSYSDYSVEFDGTGGYIGVNNFVTTASQDLTVSVWVRKGLSGGGAGTGGNVYQSSSIISNKTATDNWWRWYQYSSGHSQWKYNNQGVQVSNTIGTYFHHFVMSYDGAMGVTSTYLDGSLHVTHNTGATAAFDSPWAVGYQNVSGSEEYLTGGFDEIAIWKGAALDANQVTSLWNDGRPSNLAAGPAYGSLWNWWRMGDSPGDSATTIVDVMGNTNLTNAGSGTSIVGFSA